jgi:hypothetical protein
VSGRRWWLHLCAFPLPLLVPHHKGTRGNDLELLDEELVQPHLELDLEGALQNVVFVLQVLKLTCKFLQ